MYAIFNKPTHRLIFFSLSGIFIPKSPDLAFTNPVHCSSLEIQCCQTDEKLFKKGYV